MSRKFAYGRERLKDLVRYVAKSAGSELAVTELGKALWLAEARNFVAHGAPISGAAYRREPGGPYARGLRALLAEIAAEDAPGSSAFGTSPSADYHDSVEWALRHLGDPACEAIWTKAAIGEELPYGALLALRMREPNDEELDWAKRRAGVPAAP